MRKTEKQPNQIQWLSLWWPDTQFGLSCFWISSCCSSSTQPLVERLTFGCDWEGICVKCFQAVWSCSWQGQMLPLPSQKNSLAVAFDGSPSPCWRPQRLSWAISERGHPKVSVSLPLTDAVCGRWCKSPVMYRTFHNQYTTTATHSSGAGLGLGAPEEGWEGSRKALHQQPLTLVHRCLAVSLT